MRMISFLATVLLALLSSAALAQQPPTTGDAIGHPPPIPGPPPISDPSAAKQPTPAASTPAASAPKGYTGAYAPAGTEPIPFSTGPLPQIDSGAGLNVVGPDGSTKTVKAAPCSAAARETDGTTTCVGISDERARTKKKR